jgi:hypothetical protein
LYDEVFDLILGCDVAMGNLECPIVPHMKEPFVGSMKVAPPLVFDREERV